MSNVQIVTTDLSQICKQAPNFILFPIRRETNSCLSGPQQFFSCLDLACPISFNPNDRMM